MSETTFPGIIKDTEIQDNGVASLRTAPNRGGTWGQNGLTAGDLQKRFDALPTLIAQRLNALITSIEKGDTPESEARREAIALLNDALAAEASARIAEDAKKADKTAVEAALATKVDTPQNTSGKDRVVVSRSSGAVQTLALSDTPAENAVVKFGANKTLSSADAVTDDNTVTLRQLKAAISALVNGAPDTLNTLAELAAALKGNPDVVATLESAIAEKASKKELADEKTAREQALAGKLDVPTGASRLWGTDQNGNLVYHSWAQGASGKTFVRRTPNGQVKTNEAIADDDAVPLAQMNTALADKASGVDLVDLASRVANLEQNGGGGGGGGSATVQLVDDAVARYKRVPTNALSVAAITEIGGASEHIESLRNDEAWAEFDNKTYENEYVRATIYADGSIYVENLDDWSYGEAIDLHIKVRDIFPDAVIGKRYRLLYSFYAESNPTYGNGIYGEGYAGSDGVPFTMTEAIDNGTIYVQSVSAEEVYYDPETGEGVSSTMYPTNCEYSDIELVPYGKTIGNWYDAKVTNVEVVGRNLCGFSPKTYTTYGVEVNIADDGTITLNGKCTSSWASISTKVYIPFGKRYILRDFAEGEFPNNASQRVAITGGGGSPYLIYTRNNGELDNAFGTVDAQGYYDYVKLEIKLANGFTYNNCKLRPMLVMGVDEPKEYIPYKSKSFAIPTSVQALPAYGYGYDNELYNQIVFNDGNVVYQQRVSADRTPLSPYVETDITDMLGWDGFIEVEGGGIITFTNEHGEPVPSTIVYQTK